MASEPGPGSSSERALAPGTSSTTDDGRAMAMEGEAGPAQDTVSPALWPQEGEMALGQVGEPAEDIDLTGVGESEEDVAAWGTGPETCAWSFETEGLGDYGADSPFGAPESWEGEYQEQGFDDNQGWYTQGSGGWEGEEAVAGANGWQGEEAAEGSAGWYGEEYYQDQYTIAYARSRQEALAAYQAAYQDGYGTADAPRVWDEGDGATPVRPERLPRRATGPWPELAMVAAVAVVIAAVILAVTGADKANLSNSSQPSLSTVPSTPARPITSGPSAKAKPAASTRARKSPGKRPAKRAGKTTATSSTSSPASQAVAWPVTPAVKLSLIKSWLATNPGGVGLGIQDVAGTVPQQVFYGEQLPTRVFWAVAAFQPSETVLAQQSTAAGQDELAQFQGTDYVFNWKSGPTWNELGYVSAGGCPGEYVPPAVLTAWDLC
jgi:hypothetical protein